MGVKGAPREQGGWAGVLGFRLGGWDHPGMGSKCSTSDTQDLNVFVHACGPSHFNYFLCRESTLLQQAPHLSPAQLQRTGSGLMLSPSPLASLSSLNSTPLASQMKLHLQQLQLQQLQQKQSSALQLQLSSSLSPSIPESLRGAYASMPPASSSIPQQTLPASGLLSQRPDLRPAKRVLQRSATSCLSDGG